MMRKKWCRNAGGDREPMAKKVMRAVSRETEISIVSSSVMTPGNKFSINLLSGLMNVHKVSKLLDLVLG